MTCENCSESAVGVVRLRNRALQTVNRNLRRKLAELQAKSDKEFLALCEAYPLIEFVPDAVREQ